MKILIIKSSSLGDIVHTFPVVAYLKKIQPKATIDWVVEQPFSSLLTSHPDIRQVIQCDTKQWRKGGCFSEILTFIRSLRQTQYDLILDLQGNFKSWFFNVFARGAKKKRFHCSKLQRGNSIRNDYLLFTQNIFHDQTPFQDPGVTLFCNEDIRCYLKKTRNIVVCPGTVWPNKQLPKSSLIHILQKEEGFLLFAWGTDSERKLAEELKQEFPDRSEVIPKLPLPALQKLMSQADLVIAMDSFPLHLAATTKTSTLSFFGPSSAHKYAPSGTHHRTVQGKCPYGVKFEYRCPKLRTCKTGLCLKNIDKKSLRSERQT